MKTANDFACNGLSEHPIDIDDIQFKGSKMKEIMINFAKAHVKQALIAAALKARVKGGPLQGTTARNRAYVDLDSITTAYSEELIT